MKAPNTARCSPQSSIRRDTKIGPRSNTPAKPTMSGRKTSLDDRSVLTDSNSTPGASIRSDMVGRPSELNRSAELDSFVRELERFHRDFVLARSERWPRPLHRPSLLQLPGHDRFALLVQEMHRHRGLAFRIVSV